jgi:hypothetical protein
MHQDSNMIAGSVPELRWAFACSQETTRHRRFRPFGEASQRQRVELSRIVPERTFGADVAAHPDRAMESSVSLAT